MRREILHRDIVITKRRDAALKHHARHGAITPIGFQADGKHLITSQRRLTLLRRRYGRNDAWVRSLRDLAMVLSCATIAACGVSESGTGNSASSTAETSDAGAVTPANVPTTTRGYPRRADGWWRVQRLDPAGAAAGGQYICVGQGSEEKLSIYDQIVPFGNCSKQEFKRTAAGWAFDAVCKEMDTTMTSTGTIVGDFQKQLRVDLIVKSSDGSTQSGSVISNREGDCPTNVQGGSLADDKGKVIGNIMPQ